MPDTITEARPRQQLGTPAAVAPCQADPAGWDIPAAVRNPDEKAAVKRQVTLALAGCNSDDTPCPLRDWCRADTRRNPPPRDYDGVRGGWIWYGRRNDKPRRPVPQSAFNPIIRDDTGRVPA